MPTASFDKTLAYASVLIYTIKNVFPRNGFFEPIKACFPK